MPGQALRKMFSDSEAGDTDMATVYYSTKTKIKVSLLIHR